MAKEGQKRIRPTQEAADAVPYNSGRWRVEGSMGLYLRTRARTKTYVVVRRVGGRLVERTLQARTMAAARREAQRVWSALRPDSGGERWTLAQCLENYISERTLRPATLRNYRGGLDRFCSDWLRRPVESIMMDRVAVRNRIMQVQRDHGAGSAAMLHNVLSALFRYYRRYFPSAPEPPTAAVRRPVVQPRDAAPDESELREWWQKVQTLPALNRVYWLTVLLSAGRASSVASLKWTDIDFERHTLRFSVSKTAPYSVPLSTLLEAALREWQGVAAPGEWVFPGRQGGHIKPLRGANYGLRLEAHALRHGFRTVLAKLGAPLEIAMLLLGHSFGRSVSLSYVTANLLFEPAREWTEKVAQYYAGVLGW